MTLELFFDDVDDDDDDDDGDDDTGNDEEDDDGIVVRSLKDPQSRKKLDEYVSASFDAHRPH